MNNSKSGRSPTRTPTPSSNSNNSLPQSSSNSNNTSIKIGSVIGLTPFILSRTSPDEKNKKAQQNSSDKKPAVSPVLREVGKLAAGVASVSTLGSLGGTGGAKNVGSLGQAGGVSAGSTSTGSATGNLRNKCALQPGHSLMDWIRLGASGRDLTGVGHMAGKLSVTPAELAVHNKPNDAWLAINGRVFNVTEYLSFHPGGEDEIMKGAGKNATKLFEDVHPWVNFEQILQKCYVGRLVRTHDDSDLQPEWFRTPSTKSNDRKAAEKSENRPLSSNNNNQTEISEAPKNQTSNTYSPTSKKSVELADNVPTTSAIFDTPDSTTTFVSQRTLSSSKKDDVALGKSASIEANKIEPVTLPKFDWIQKLDFITLIFYTGSFFNPLIEVNQTSPDSCTIFITTDSCQFDNEMKFMNSVDWPGQIKVVWETGKIEIIFHKRESKIWENYGILKQSARPKTAVNFDRVQFKHVIRSKMNVNYNTFLIGLEKCGMDVDDGSVTTSGLSSQIVVPLGKHVKVFERIEDTEVSRSYTPVPSCLLLRNKYQPQTLITDQICLMVKRYPDGNVSKSLCDKKIGDHVTISKPLGSFDLKMLEKRENFIVLAAGTGITPMLSVMLFLLERRIRKCQFLRLLFFNRTPQDILLRTQLESLQREEPRFKMLHILSQKPDADNSTSDLEFLQGHIGKNLIESTINEHLNDTAYTKRDLFFLCCGPTIFTNLAYEFLKELDIGDNQMHLFLG